ncbi:MAG: hypothetical protein K7J46_00385 [Bryobacter sp.]|jgi:hypothetical protein|nr:hypothetical protein [Bryobacter sp. CoA8 C33]
MKFILLLLLLAQPAGKAELRQKIADLKLKAFEMQMQIELLEKQLHDVEEAEANLPPPTIQAKPPVKTRCSGHNKNGARCSRNAEAGSRFCWQHKPRR